MPVYFKKYFQCLGHAGLRQVVIWIVRLGPSQVEKGWPVSFVFSFLDLPFKLEIAKRCQVYDASSGSGARSRIRYPAGAKHSRTKNH